MEAAKLDLSMLILNGNFKCRNLHRCLLLFEKRKDKSSSCSRTCSTSRNWIRIKALRVNALFIPFTDIYCAINQNCAGFLWSRGNRDSHETVKHLTEDLFVLLLLLSLCVAVLKSSWMPFSFASCLNEQSSTWNSAKTMRCGMETLFVKISRNDSLWLFIIKMRENGNECPFSCRLVRSGILLWWGWIHKLRQVRSRTFFFSILIHQTFSVINFPIKKTLAINDNTVEQLPLKAT